MVAGLLRVLGLDSANGVAYLWWSGVGADLSLFGGLGAVAYGFYRKHNCEVAGCWRFARHTTDAAHHVCRRHHPDGAPSAEDVARAHAEAGDR